MFCLDQLQDGFIVNFLDFISNIVGILLVFFFVKELIVYLRSYKSFSLFLIYNYYRVQVNIKIDYEKLGKFRSY